MRRGDWIALMSTWALLAACKPTRDGAGATATADAAPAEAPDAAVAAQAPAALAITTEDGRRLPLPHAKAYPTGKDGAIEIRLSDVDGPCGQGFKPPWKAVMSIGVPPGPGNRYFAGAPFGTSLGAGEIGEGGFFSGYSKSAVRVSLEPFTPRAGERIRGTVALPNGDGGAFTVELCPGDYGRSPPLADSAPDSPLGGTIAGKPFTGVHALATVSEHSEQYRELATLVIFAEEGPTCATLKAKDGPAMVWLSDFGGASNQVPLAGTPQPATASFRAEKGGELFYLWDSAWVQLDSLELEPGSKLRGRVVTASRDGVEPAIELAGSFTAEICPRN